MPSQSPSAFVITSSVRREIVTLLAESGQTTGDLLEAIEASESAIYDALSTLRERGICVEGEKCWTLTAQGKLIADLAAGWHATDEFLEADPAYWNEHRLDVVPAAFRRRLPEIGAYEIVRDGPREPNKHEEVIVSRFERADHCLVTTSFYSKKFEDVIPNSPKTRMLTTRDVAEVAIDRYLDGLREHPMKPEQCVRRLTECRFTFVVTDECLVFRLPVTSRADSGDRSAADHYSLTATTATFISETPAALEWGTDLFETLWERSDPLEPYLEGAFPDLHRELS